MELDPKALRDSLRKILDIEHAHLYGAKTGSESARRREVDTKLGHILDQLVATISTDTRTSEEQS